jgi:hypothetical protein
MLLNVAIGAVAVAVAACAGSRQTMAPAAPPQAATTVATRAPVESVPTSPEPSPPVDVKQAAADPVFEATVRPLLAKNCTPCHVPGGRMYDRMPFDQPGIVQEFQAGILRRLKVPEENQAVQDWLKTASAR